MSVLRLRVAGRKIKSEPKLQTVGLLPQMSAALDELIARQPNPKPSRPEMIRRVLARRLAEEGLSVVDVSQPRKTG